jgi:hypothetical protein
VQVCDRIPWHGATLLDQTPEDSACPGHAYKGGSYASFADRVAMGVLVLRPGLLDGRLGPAGPRSAWSKPDA